MGKKKKTKKLPLTIEKRLRMYSEEDDHDERHEILWHAWNQNKRWLAQLLQMTMLSFPTYSLHNDSHAKSVLYNMEKILGEDRINCLSPTDCFMLLHVAYIHDIGMCITADDKEAMYRSDEFIYLLEKLRDNGDLDMKNAANSLLKQLNSIEGSTDNDDDFEQMKLGVGERFDVYQAVMYLMQEAQRGQHGIKSEEQVIDWTMNPSKMGIAFSMSGVPLRIFVWIARCAGMHTDWNFESVLGLPMKDSGYVHDEIHPRFVAVMLQIGDALDLDNGRFHMFTKMVMGDLPIQSQAHYNKHQSIRQLEISSEKIMIMADCNSQQALRLVRSECDNVERLLQNASYFWARIAPQDMGGCLPTMYNPVLMLNGKVIPKELVTCKFEISQSKAFRILQGENVYLGKFPFMRELIQNAIDATKMQCWRELQASAIGNRNADCICDSSMSLPEFASKILPENYPIEIELEYGYLDDSQQFHLINDSMTIGPNVNVGVFVQIKDYGVGISEADIVNIADVGTSYQNRRAVLRKMPEWLKPTGEFGIGLQSVFYFFNWFKCVTYCRNGECYSIEFCDRSNGGSGYINVEPLDAAVHNLTYGTVFQVFIPYGKKFSHDKFILAWEGKDMFAEDYDRTRASRHSLELMKQIIMDVDSQIGEPLFPIYFHINSTGLDVTNVNRWLKEIENVIVDVSPGKEKLNATVLKNHISWLYDRDKKVHYQVYNIDGGLCAFDTQNVKIYLWISEMSCAVKIGARRILDCLSNAENSSKNVKIYYKGIYVDEIRIYNDLGLIEYIDLKGSLKREDLQLSRNGFTDSGKQFIKSLVEQVILPYLERTLDVIGREQFPDVKTESECGDCYELSENEQNEKIQRIVMFEKTYENNKKRKEIQLPQKEDWENWLGRTVLAYFYEIYAQKEKSIVAKSMFWQLLLKESEETMNVFRGIVEKNRSMVHIPNFSSIIFFKITRQSVKQREDPEKLDCIVMKVNKRDKSQRANLAGILLAENHWMIVSKRAFEGDYWKHFLFQFDSEDAIPMMLESNLAAEPTEYSKWHDAIISLNLEVDLRENQEAVTDFSQQLLLSWMLRNMPTVAYFGTADGNMRVNVLGKTVRTCMHRDYNMTYLILERMVQNYRMYGAMRFAVVAWNNYGELGISEVPPSVCRINRGYMQRDFYEWIICPFTGKQLEVILYSGEAKNIEKIYREYEEIEDCFNIIDYLTNDSENFQWEKREDWIKKIKNNNGENSFIYVQRLLYNYVSELESEYEKKYVGEPDFMDGMCTLPERAKLYDEFLDFWLNGKYKMRYMEQFAQYICIFKRELETMRTEGDNNDLQNMIKACRMSAESKKLYEYIANAKAVSVRWVEDMYHQLMEEIVDVVKEHNENKLKPIETAVWYNWIEQ